MKPVVFNISHRFTKDELVNVLYNLYEDTTSFRELNREVKRKHVVAYGREMLKILKEHSYTIREDAYFEYSMDIAEEIAKNLNITREID